MTHPKISTTNKCPRCGLFKMFEEDVLNSLSHTYAGVKICNDCGTEESLVLVGLGSREDKVRQIQWENKKF